MENNDNDKISILLPYYWWEDIPNVLEMLGFNMFWSDNPDVSKRNTETEKFVMDNEPDLAIEWQWGRNDFPIRDLLNKYGRDTPVVLTRNWGCSLPNDPDEIGCAGYLNVPFEIKEMHHVFYNALPDRKKPVLLKLHGTKKPCHLFRIE